MKVLIGGYPILVYFFYFLFLSTEYLIYEILGIFGLVQILQLWVFMADFEINSIWINSIYFDLLR